MKGRKINEDYREKNKESMPRKFVRYKEGAAMYGMGISKFMEIARSARATYKINQLVLVNLEILDEYFELYPLSRTQEILVALFFRQLLFLVSHPIDMAVLSTHVIGHLVTESLVLCEYYFRAVPVPAPRRGGRKAALAAFAR